MTHIFETKVKNGEIRTTIGDVNVALDMPEWRYFYVSLSEKFNMFLHLNIMNKEFGVYEYKQEAQENEIIVLVIRLRVNEIEI